MVVVRDLAAPKLSDRPLFVTLSAHVVLMVAAMPVSLGHFEYLSTALALYLTFLITGLVAFGTLLGAMLTSAAWKTLRPTPPSHGAEPTPAGRLAAA